MNTLSFPATVLPPFYFSNLSFSHIFRLEHPAWKPLERIGEVLREIKHDSEKSCIHPTARVHQTAIIRNSLISSNCFIGEYAVVRDSLIGPGCIIGHCSEVARSIIMQHSAITHFCFIGDSIIGQHVMIGGGVRTANRRLDKGYVTIRLPGQEISTERSFLGSIIGDGCRIGGGVHPNPGTLLGREVYVMPGIDLRGFVPPFSFVKARWTLEIVHRSDCDEALALESSIADMPDTYNTTQDTLSSYEI